MEMTKQEVDAAMAAGDMNVINAVINKQIAIKSDEPEQQVNEMVAAPAPEMPVQEPVSTDTQMLEETPVQELAKEPVQSALLDAREAELEQERRYAKFQQEKYERERQEYLDKLKAEREEKERLKRQQEEAEQQLQALRNQYNQSPSPVGSTSDDDDDEVIFYSEGERQTRRMVEGLEKSLNTVAKPEDIQDIKSQLQALKLKFEEVDRIKKEEADKERHKEQQNRTFRELEDFTIRHNEYSFGEKNVRDIFSDYNRFRQDLAVATNARNQEELEKYIANYVAGGEVKTLADEKGIKPVEKLSSFLDLADLLDMKRGRRLNKNTGRYEPILDDEGQPVRYRSLEEAYQVKNFYGVQNEALVRERQQLREKLNSISPQTTAVTLQPQEVSPIIGPEAKAMEDQRLINMDPRQYRNNPELAMKVNEAYQRMGLTAPKRQR